MASKRAAGPAKHLFNGFRAASQPRQPCLIRTMATEAPSHPAATIAQTYTNAQTPSASTDAPLRDDVSIPTTTPSSQAFQAAANPFLTTTSCTLHKFPTFEPTSFVAYPSTHLMLPLRKDLLHRAVIYEGDMTRQGTASTKWRKDVHGSNKKIRPQKGSGAARLGDKKSPMLKGGGVAFGPKPRDFSTELQRKVYDKAWRTALSYRYRRGELVVIDGEAEIEGVARGSLERYARDVLKWQNMGHAGGRTLFITSERRENLFDALSREKMGREALALEVEYVDVKDLLELGRLVVEREALDEMLLEHESDLNPEQQLATLFMVAEEDLDSAADAQL